MHIRYTMGSMMLLGIIGCSSDATKPETASPSPAMPSETASAVVMSDADAWVEAQKTKRRCLELCARHAMEQQKTDAAPAIAIPWTEATATGGRLKIARTSEQEVRIEVTASPAGERHATPNEWARFKLPKPIDMAARHSGLALFVRTEPGASPEVRIGCRLIGPGGKDTLIEPYIPILSAWGDNAFEIYFDWNHIAYENAEDAAEALRAVEAIEITFAARQRAPKRGPSGEARLASAVLSNLRLVDYLKGLYDPSRQSLAFDEAEARWKPSGKLDYTLQHRVQEVTGVVATYGGEAGVRSAVDSLDFCARTQCWDGSFLDGRRGARTVTSGEYTYGFTTYGLISGYRALENMRSPFLDEPITVGTDTRTRRAFYHRMFHRMALSHAAALPSEYRDDIIGGDTLMTGANRVLGYAIAMRMVADVLPDKDRKEEVLAHYRRFMAQIASAQGKYSGGFPILGEGDKHDGRGIHYDAGYTRTHMDWLIVGARQTGDPLIIEMLRKYQTVFESVMGSNGAGLCGLVSERNPKANDVQLILPDGTAQAGLKYKLPIIAQWGYNVGMPVWRTWGPKSGNHFTFASRGRGYGLGTFTGRLMEDIEPEPRPKDLGYLFPRQYPIWSARLYTKDGKLQRTLSVTFNPDGKVSDNFTIEVGEYPVMVGVPVTVKSAQGKVTARADKLDGWPKLLSADAELTLSVSGSPAVKAQPGKPVKFVLSGETRVKVDGPEIELPPEAGGTRIPFRAEFMLTPEKSGQAIELTVWRGLP